MRFTIIFPKFIKILTVTIILTTFTSCFTQNQEKGELNMLFTSSAFSEGKLIPSEYTCDGDDLSPPLSWSEVPKGTESFALIMDDPDAPMGTWVHWVIYNLPANKTSLSKGFPTDEKIDDGTLQGINDFKKIGYGGPCPPSGTHRYYFKLYALDSKLDLSAGSSKKELLRAMEGHIVGRGQLIGTYSKK